MRVETSKAEIARLHSARLGRGNQSAAEADRRSASRWVLASDRHRIEEPRASFLGVVETAQGKERGKLGAVPCLQRRRP